MHLFPPSRRRLASLRSTARTGRDGAAAGTLLGEGNPLVRVLEAIDRIGDQLAWVASAHGVGLALWAMGVRAGTALCLAALAMEVVLGSWLFLLALSRRDLCLTSIVEGREGLPLAAIARECRHLRRPRHRAQLARALTRLSEPPPFGAYAMTARPPIEARVVKPVRPQLRELAARLEDDDVSVRGVAAAERLVSSPCSPLYGPDPDALRREVGRARYLLCS
jgi:hypothetical protein